jgi:hypothetical protein
MRMFTQTNRYGKVHDQRGAGGNIAWGVRRVRAGGKVRFDRSTFQHDDLLPLVGQDVEVTDPEDIWWSNKIRIQNLRGGLICYANNEQKIPRESPAKTRSG